MPAPTLTLAQRMGLAQAPPAIKMLTKKKEEAAPTEKGKSGNKGKKAKKGKKNKVEV